MNKLLETVKEMFAKLFYILKEISYMVKKHKMYFLLPILILFAILAFLIYYIGPAVMYTFIYAGV